MTPLLPVTLVTGFLGAGKTTLLEHILNAETGLKFAIIENEFGFVGVDGARVSAPRDAVYELNDGCVCCTVREDLFETFAKIQERHSEFDHVIIETTGLAEPGPVMKLFDRPSVRNAFTLNGVVTVVDACHLEASLNDVSACAEQITYADLLVLNKVDGISPVMVPGLESRLKQLNPLARICHAQHAQIDVADFLDLQRVESDLHTQSVEHHHHHHQHDHHHHDHHDHDHHHHHHDHHDHDHHEHDADIRPVVVEAPGNIDIDALDLWLDALTRNGEQLLLRMKGTLAVADSKRRFIFNGVRRALDVRQGHLWNDEPRYNRIVFIGKGLSQESLQSTFESFIDPGSK